MIIDANDMVLGRVATFAAKKALLGEKVNIVNCEKAVMTGNKETILAKYRQKRERGRPTKGPFIHRRSDMFVRRAIRGMLPYKQAKGKDAFQRVMCYMGVPEEFKEKDLVKVEGAETTKLPNLKFTKVEEICKFMGGR